MLSFNKFLAEPCYVTFGLWHEPSVCRLSVTLLGRDLNFSAIFLHVQFGVFRPILRFISKYDHSYNGRQIGTRM